LISEWPIGFFPQMARISLGGIDQGGVVVIEQ
jgi:hypothetical protein